MVCFHVLRHPEQKHSGHQRLQTYIFFSTFFLRMANANFQFLLLTQPSERHYSFDICFTRKFQYYTVTVFS